jgi:hypothetical protein
MSFHRRSKKSVNQNIDSVITMKGIESDVLAMPSARDLLAISPTPFNGYCMKKSTSILSYVMPCLFPKWKKRFFVVVGNFLFRYENENANSPKGMPVPLNACFLKVIDNRSFELSTVRKSYIIRTDTDNDAYNWIMAIKMRQSDAIREQMGHIVTPEDVKRINKSGQILVKERIKKDRFKITTDAKSMFYNPMSSSIYEYNDTENEKYSSQEY